MSLNKNAVAILIAVAIFMLLFLGVRNFPGLWHGGALSRFGSWGAMLGLVLLVQWMLLLCFERLFASSVGSFFWDLVYISHRGAALLLTIAVLLLIADDALGRW